jgi:hypothetical protein
MGKITKKDEIAFNLAHDIVNESVKMGIDEMEPYIRKIISEFKDNCINMSDIRDRGALHWLIEISSTLFLNLWVNGRDMLFYEDSEIEKGKKGRQIIFKIRDEIKEKKF